ncbi:MAG: response regulator [Paludibacter sp.]|jgi:signal transduction histidine kinase/CheY-like chemotaxis protein|nr:response regulator [Paludibacter sp.]
MFNDSTTNQPEKSKREIDEMYPELFSNKQLLFDWTCNNLNCNYQKLVNAITLIYTAADLEDVERDIPLALRLMAKFTGADHIAVCESRNRYRTITRYYEWNAEDVEFLQGDSGKVTTATLLKSYYPFHSRNQEIFIQSTEKAGPDQEELKNLMAIHGIRSLISLPMTANDTTLIGTLELFYFRKNTDFHDREKNLLRFLTQLQVNVMQRIFKLKQLLSDADTYLSKQLQNEKELLLAREHAEAAKKTKDTFFVNLSHEIRTPLNIIAGMQRELMREKLTARQKSFIQQSTIASRYLLNLFNNVLDINDMEAGTFHLNQKDFSLRQLLLEVKEMMEGKAEEKKAIEFQFIISESLYPAYRGDAQRLQQILVKLISNAFKFTNEGLIRVEVTIRRKTSGFHELLFEISDTGIGMGDSFKNKVFDKFTQEDDSLTRMHEGAGLGLYICYRLADQMGGSIRMESEQDAGTQFQLTLPLQLGDTKILEAQQSVTGGYNFKDRRILLVEDNDTNRFIARQTLQNTGCQITEAINGQEAIELVSKHNFDLILMDIQMPVMNGMIATRIIRQELKLTLPIIAFTANAIDSEIARYLSFGMDDYIVKPYRETDLYEKIYKLIYHESMNQEAIPMNEKLYDLGYLRELSQGDESFTKQIIETFIAMVEQSVVQLQTALENKDVETLRKIAHKIKPTLANFQINSLKELVEKVNSLKSENTNWEEIRNDTNKITGILTTIQVQLKKDIE